MRLILFLLLLSPVFASAQILRAYGVIEIGGFPTSSTTGPKFAYNPADSSFYRWSHGSVWVKVIEPSITSDTIFITSEIGTSYVVSGDTINLTPYLLKSDTTAMLVKYIERGDTNAMLTNYPSTAGYGIIDAGKTWRADTTSPNGLSTRLFAKTLPTSILTGQVAYSNGSNLIGSANHFWDNTNVRLGIGTNAPTYTIDANISSSSPTYIRARNINSGTAAAAGLLLSTDISDVKTALVAKTGSNYTAYKTLSANDYILYNGGTAGSISILNDFSSGVVKFASGGSSTAQMTLATTGNLLLGTTTDVPTSILTARSTTKSSSPFPLHTLAESDAITGVQGNFDYETTQNGLRWYNGTRKAYALESTFARGTATRVPFFDANGQVTEASGFTFNSASSSVLGGLTITASLSGGSANGIYLNPTFSGSGGSFSGLKIVSNAKYAGYGSAMIALTPSSANGIYIEGTASRALIELIPTNSTSRALQVLSTSDNNFGSTAFLRASSTIGVGTGFRMAVNPSGTSDAAVSYEIGASITEVSGSLSRNALIFQNRRNSIVSERMRLTDIGYLGIGTATPLQELDVNGDAYIRDSIRLTTTPAHTAITGLLTRDATGWVGATTFGTDLKYSGGVLGLKRKSLIDSLPLASVTIDADSNSLTFNNLTSLSINQADDFELSVQQGKIVDIPSNKITASESTLLYELGDNELSSYFGSRLQRATGITARVKNVLYGNWIRYDADLDEEYSYETSLESYQDTLGINWTGATVRFGQDNLHYEGISSGGTNSGIAGPNVTTPSWIVQSQYAGSSRMDWLKVDLNENDSTAHAVNIYEKYALPNENPDLNKSTAIGFFNGAPAMIQLARDTFIEDVTLFAVGTLMNSCQELTIVSSMTSTASTHMEIRFPDAADYLRGRKIIVYSKKKDAGSYIPEIRVVGGASRLFFTTNSAVLGTDPIDQSVLQIDDSTWSDHGTTFEFTCLKIDNTPSYRWVLKQR